MYLEDYISNKLKNNKHIMMSFEEIPHCDVFHPTWQEFADFQGYVSKIQKVAKSGIVKVSFPNPDCST